MVVFWQVFMNLDSELIGLLHCITARLLRNARAIFTRFVLAGMCTFCCTGVQANHSVGSLASRLCSERWSCPTEKVVKASLLARHRNLLQLFVSQLFTLVGVTNSVGTYFWIISSSCDLKYLLYFKYLVLLLYYGIFCLNVKTCVPTSTNVSHINVHNLWLSKKIFRARCMLCGWKRNLKGNIDMRKSGGVSCI